MRFYSSKKKKEKSNPKSKNSRDGNVIKSEIYGLLLISLGILLGLAIISYHQGDPVGLLNEGNIFKVRNWLGLFGSTIAAPIFQWTLGYPIVLLPFLIITYGFYLLIRLPVANLKRFTLLLIVWAFFSSVLLALPESIKTFGNIQSFYPSGFLGGMTAAYLVKVFSRFGAVFISVVVFLILLIVTFHVRISSIPLFIGQKLFDFTEFVKQELGRIRISLPRRRNLRPAGVQIPKTKGRNLPPEPEEDFNNPLFQPSLPSEKEEEPETDEINPIEIVHNGINSVKNNDGLPDESDPVAAGVIADEVPESQNMSDDAKILGFEVQEAHVEKELDYDALVRDSMSKYQFPSSELLTELDDGKEFHLSETELMNNARLLEETLAQFGVKATVNRVVEGPVITLYEVKPAQGVKISQIVGLADDLALAMRAKGIRMIAPIPGKAAIGIEIPNRQPSTVYFRSIVRSQTFINFTGNLPLGVGKTISGEVFCADLTKMPHLLMAGATGSGKSVGINTMIASLLYRIPPSDLKFVMIDPKKLELSIYAKLKDHYLATCPDLDEVVITHPQNAIMMLRSVVNEMEERYDKLASMGVREITHYNRKIDEYHQKGETSEEFRRLPYLVVVIDELADLILTASREVEEPITRLAQMARAVGIHLIMATQRPSVDILTGLIKANFPSRIAYQVATRPDSKVILDMYGAEKLIGNGDMLFMPPGKMKPLRLQNPLISTEEVERMIKHIRKQPKFPPYELKLMRMKEKGPGVNSIFERDELFEKAKETVIRYQQGSVSLLQRKLKIGYARAARIVDELEEAGIVGPQNQEGKAREVLVSGYSIDPE